jgi:hypothetical protein
MYDLGHITKLEKINKHSLAWGRRLMRIKIETKHGIFTTLVWNRFWHLFEEFIENFWELKRERERERAREHCWEYQGHQWKTFLVGNKIKLMCWDLKMETVVLRMPSSTQSSFTLVAMHHSLRVTYYYKVEQWLTKTHLFNKVVEALLKEMNYSLSVTGFL